MLLKSLSSVLALLSIAAPVAAVAQAVEIHNYSVEEDGQRDDIPFIAENASQTFFGSRHANIAFKAPLAEQFEASINGRVYDQIDLGNGYFVYTACGQEDCARKGIAVIDGAGELVAAGIIGYQCPGPVGECNDLPIAAGFLKTDPNVAFARQTLAEWAMRYLEDLPKDERNISIMEL